MCWFRPCTVIQRVFLQSIHNAIEVSFGNNDDGVEYDDYTCFFANPKKGKAFFVSLNNTAALSPNGVTSSAVAAPFPLKSMTPTFHVFSPFMWVEKLTYLAN